MPAWRFVVTALPGNPDVIVVGAGISGLSAAQRLLADGYEVTVLEAVPHVGGRCVTDIATFETPFDIGASWLHSAAINPLARTAEERKERLHKSAWKWRWLHTEGRTRTGPDVAEYSDYQDKMWAHLRSHDPSQPDRPASAGLPASPWRAVAQNWVAQMQGGDADAVSSADIARYREGEGDWLVAGGLGTFVRGLFTGVPVQLDCPVHRIDMTGKGVRAHTPRGTVTARHLVLTVSTGVLDAERIEFIPPLPARKLSAIADLPNGLLNKVGIAFDPAWSGAGPGQMADYHVGGEEYCTLLFGFFETSMAVGFVAGRFADALEAEGAGAATAFCLDGVRAIFGTDAARRVTKTAETAWRGNPCTFGAYSYARPNGADARRDLAEPVDDRLFFAGEATTPEAYATVHGAYLSGIKAAQKIAALPER